MLKDPNVEPVGVEEEGRERKSGRPFLSLVACSRNDDHGGDAAGRTRASLECTFAQLEAHGIDSEYIMVEWNPPADRAGLAEAIDWPRGLRHTTIRIIEVPAAVHQRYKLHERWPLFTVVAYNTGLRRARGDFAVLSMIDHLYPDSLMAFLKSGLRLDRAYRVPRADVDPGVLDETDWRRRLSYCRDNVIRRTTPPERPLHPDLPPLFTDGCGDFQLMALDVWHRLRGYRERDGMPQHVDSFIHYAAHALGVAEEVVEDAVVYHIDHSGGWTDRLARGHRLGSVRYRRQYIPPPVTARDKAVSFLHRILLLETGPLTAETSWPYYRRQMVRLGLGKQAHDFNGEDWGLGGETLKEIVINRAAWDGERTSR